MATQTETAIQSLRVEMVKLQERVQWVQNNTEEIQDIVSQVQEITRQLAVIQHQLTEMSKTKDLWSQRSWAVLLVVLTAGFSLAASVIGATLTFYLNTKK